MTEYFYAGRNTSEPGELYVKMFDSNEWVKVGEVTLAMLQTTNSTATIPPDHPLCRNGINPGDSETASTKDWEWPKTKTYVPDWKPPKGIRRIRIKKRER